MKNIDFEQVGAEERKLLLGLGLPALMEIRLIELNGMEAAVDELRGMPGMSTECSYQRTMTVLKGHRFAGAIGQFLVWRGLARRVHGEECPHLVLTEWGQEFVGGVVNNSVMGR